MGLCVSKSKEDDGQYQRNNAQMQPPTFTVNPAPPNPQLVRQVPYVPNTQTQIHVTHQQHPVNYHPAGHHYPPQPSYQQSPPPYAPSFQTQGHPPHQQPVAGYQPPGHHYPPQNTHHYPPQQQQYQKREGDYQIGGPTTGAHYDDRMGHQYLDSRNLGAKPPVDNADNIPLELESWFFGKIDLERCVRILGDPSVPYGTFLVRDSTSSENTLCISLKAITSRGPEICSIRITQGLNRQGQTQFSSTHDKRVFSSMKDLIKHYQAKGIPSSGTALKVVEGVKNTRHNDFNRSGDRFEISAADITDTGVRLGEGNFGVVSKGILRKPNGTTINVALKQLKNVNRNQIEAFKKEVDVLKMVYHDNIVTFYGVCPGQEGGTIMVSELLSKGELLKHLRKNKDLPLADLLYFALKISSGMKFLESKKIVHRDLAARNVLLGEHHLVKINDFGMSRLTSEDDGIYNASKGGPLPVKWTAPEGFKSQFTSKSDVWSYGILLTEIVTHGNEPYKNISSRYIYDRVEHHGLRMTQGELGEHCSDEIYQLMTDCWKRDPAHRPNFTEVFTRMTEIYIPSAPLLYR